MPDLSGSGGPQQPSAAAGFARAQAAFVKLSSRDAGVNCGAALEGALSSHAACTRTHARAWRSLGHTAQGARTHASKSTRANTPTNHACVRRSVLEGARRGRGACPVAGARPPASLLAPPRRAPPALHRPQANAKAPSSCSYMAATGGAAALGGPAACASQPSSAHRARLALVWSPGRWTGPELGPALAHVPCSHSLTCPPPQASRRPQSRPLAWSSCTPARTCP